MNILIIIKFITSNIRNVKYVDSKLVGLELLQQFSKYLSDENNLHILLPNVCALYDDSESIVILI